MKHTDPEDGNDWLVFHVMVMLAFAFFTLMLGFLLVRRFNGQ